MQNIKCCDVDMYTTPTKDEVTSVTRVVALLSRGRSH